MGTGATIKALLSRRGMTIKQLAERSGIPVNTLYAITKRDTENIYSDNLQKILSALGLTLEEFQNEKEYTAHESPARSDERRPIMRALFPDEWLLLEAYFNLNAIGKKEALERVSELALLDKYTREE